jgi:hypothetical protein
MFYCLTKHQIQQLYYRKIKPKAVLKLEHRLVFTYTGEDVLEYAGQKRVVPDDVIDTIGERAAYQANLGDVLCDAVEDAMGPLNKVEELDQ